MSLVRSWLLCFWSFNWFESCNAAFLETLVSIPLALVSQKDELDSLLINLIYHNLLASWVVGDYMEGGVLSMWHPNLVGQGNNFLALYIYNGDSFNHVHMF